MKAHNFIYDGESLEDHGFVICTFDGPDGLETISAGSEMTMNTVMQAEGRKYDLASVTYEACYEMPPFQICKTAMCSGNQNQEGAVITIGEYRDIMRWLNRKKYLEFRVDDDEWQGIYVEGTFNVSRIEIDGVLYGLELTLITNRPYALLDPVTESLTFSSNQMAIVGDGIVDEAIIMDYCDDIQTAYDQSDEIGYIYPVSMIVTLLAGGDLVIYNSLEDRTTQILNCSYGEVITMNCQYHIISSSLPEHNIATDFNYTFFRLANTYSNRANEIIVSLPCTIEITYNPISKAVM